MEQARQQWMQWLKAIPFDQQAVLFDVMMESHEIKPFLNEAIFAKDSTQKVNEVTVTRTETRDLYVTNPPPYVDILKLHEIYQRIAFDTNLIIKGAKGIAKSLSVITYAALTKTPVVIQECSEDTKNYNLMGSQSLLGDRTVFVLGSLPTAIDVANEVGSCILLFEEINALTPQVQKQLNALTDFRKMVSLPHIGKSYKLRDGAKLWVAATMNPSTYGGSYDLNEDLKSRFEEVEVTYPEQGQEKMIVRNVCGNVLDDKTLDMILGFAKETRQQATGYALSTRDVVRLVNTVTKLGLPIALQFVLCKFEGEDRDVVKKRMEAKFGPTLGIKKYWSP